MHWSAGYITKKGYRRVYYQAEGRYRMEHNLVWEKHKGQIPTGYQVHHKNENKVDNDIDNLVLLDPLTHKRIHSGCELRSDGWWKPCNGENGCGRTLPVSAYYEKSDGLVVPCRECHIKIVVSRKQRKRAITKI